MNLNKILEKIQLLKKLQYLKSIEAIKFIEQDFITFNDHFKNDKEIEEDLMLRWRKLEIDTVYDICQNILNKEISINAKDYNFAYLYFVAGMGGLDTDDLKESIMNTYYKFIKEFDNRSYIDKDFIFIYNFELFNTLHYTENIVYKIIRVSPYCNKRQTSFIKIVCDADFKAKSRISEKDVIIEATKSSGAGGQHVNKTNSAIRMTHKPTKLSVFISEERSQSLNKKIALKKLQNKIDELEVNEQKDKKYKNYKSNQKISFGNNFDRIINLHQNKYLKLKKINKKISIQNIEDIDLYQLITEIIYSVI